MIQLLLNKTTPHFQLLPMSKVDQSQLLIHEVPPLQKAKSQVIATIPQTFFSHDKMYEFGQCVSRSDSVIPPVLTTKTNNDIW